MLYVRVNQVDKFGFPIEKNKDNLESTLGKKISFNTGGGVDGPPSEIIKGLSRSLNI